MNKTTINATYQLPQEFYEIIRPYVDQKNPLTVDTSQNLLAIWQAALQYQHQFPELQESIAEWTMSAAASSSLVVDNGLFETIHDTFGELEVEAADRNIEKWKKLEQLIAEAQRSLQERRDG